MFTHSVPHQTRHADDADAPTVAVVGLGYVGLPTALALLTSGSRVIGLDVSAARLDAIRDRSVDLLPADHERLTAAVRDPRLTLTTDPAALAAADTVIVCVPTPVDAHLVPDLDALAAACATAVAHAVPGQLLMLTSTTYVGTTRDLLVGPLTARGFTVGEDIHVAFSPERIDPGNAHHAQDSTPRVVGGATERCTELAAEVLLRTAPSVHRVTSPETAEMSKLYENTFRAVNIALANEFADNCRSLSLDPLEVIDAAATKPYGFMPFYPGPGVGGHCIPCDPHYLLWQLRRLRIASPLVDTAMTAIAGRPRQVVGRVRELLGERGRPVAGARILLVGVSYKPGVADLRESPALEILEELADLGAEVSFHDPLVTRARLHGKLADSVVEPAAETWDLVVVHTVHPGSDLGWLTGQSAVLDATYRLTDLPSRAVL
ncbi:nucleotide sugar dehydrogenase [Kitasatospora paracochleata]|uniref:Nucleotide sugar dehydrogenase n=1 Tax=Kitasatospora paracochleata TaxID=58354 RepID=A0ABT1J7M1_9ACTN|nr:nucleotide sugar dehydrogenase [Kitasatospora paracochleata]MCP2313204.1 nucleotide sugar dehydrogenase [Kitasatospora paracochleata]